MVINFDKMEKSIDPQSGAILFHKTGFSGIPDKTLNGKGFTVEFKDGEIVMIDIYYPEEVIGKLLGEFVEHEQKA